MSHLVETLKFGQTLMDIRSSATVATSRKIDLSRQNGKLIIMKNTTSFSTFSR